MKNSFAIRLGYTVVIITLLIIMQRCSKTTAASAKDIAQKQLTSGTWTLENFTVDNVDKTSLYSGMTLSFSVGTRACTKAP
jgi:hypothetical protein